MPATRRQSKTIEPPALPPIAPPKRKRSDDAASTQSAAQRLNQPSTKRRKKVKSTAKVDSSVAAPTFPAPVAGNAEKPTTSKTAKRKARVQTAPAKKTGQSETTRTNPASLQKPAHSDLTNDGSSEDEASRRPQHATSQDAKDEDADSRYALGSKRQRALQRPAAPVVHRTAELKFEEDGLEEIDKAQAAVVDARNRRSTRASPGPMSLPSLSELGPSSRNKKNVTQMKEMRNGNDKVVQNNVSPTGPRSKVIMFTTVEAVAALSLYKDGTMSMAANIDPESRQPYEPLQTGEHLSYPVTSKYHLGAFGRYGVDTISAPPFALAVALSPHSFVEPTDSAAHTAPSRHGLGFVAIPTGPKYSSTRRQNNYCFTFGKYCGRRMDSVPILYLRSIFQGDEYYADAKLQQAFTDLYPKGLYESEIESFTFEKGGFKGKRFDEVPKSYLWGLVRKKNAGEEVGGKKVRERLLRALEAWERGQLDFTKD